MLKFPLNATDYYAYNSVPSVESIKLITILFGKMGQNGRRSKCATFYEIICVIGTLIKLKFIQIVIVLKVPSFKSHFKIRVEAL